MNHFYARLKSLIFNPTILIPPILIIFFKKIFTHKNNTIWIENIIDYNFIFKVFNKKTVLNGPFKGMLYPSLDSTGSALFPKLLGSYESELHTDVEELLKKKFIKIIDIGCAEGYYAVGFARYFPNAKIYVFDINQDAIRMCNKMAILNGINNISYNKACTNKWILENDLSNTLIISDCEGFELDLFTDEQTVFHLSKTTIIIETHDFVDLFISDKLKNCYKETHYVKSIFSIDDIKKTKIYNYPELNNTDIKTKYAILREGRPYSMEWLILTPKL
jgi:hypothetical protein